MVYRFHGTYRKRTMSKGRVKGRGLRTVLQASETLRVSTTIAARNCRSTAKPHNLLPSTISTRVHHQEHGAQNFNASPCTSFRTTMNSRRDPGPSCYSRHNRKCESTKSYLITSNEKKNLQNSPWGMLHSHLCGFIVYFSFIINPYSHVLMYDSVSLTCDSRAMANAKNMN